MAAPSGDAEYIAMPSGTMFGMGWLRFLPPPSMVFAAVSAYGEPTAAQISRFTDVLDTNLGVDTPAWGEPRTWTEEELRLLHADYPPGPDSPGTAAEVNAEEHAEHTAKIAEIDGYAAGLGLPPVRTLADMITYMTACRLLIATDSDDGQTRYRLNPDPPLPTEILTVPHDVRAREDKLRWDYLYEPIAQRIIALFTSPEAGHPASKRTSLQRLARELGLDTETTRAGLITLIGYEDFTATRDPETVAEHQVFEIQVDWELFATNRITIRLATSDD